MDEDTHMDNTDSSLKDDIPPEENVEEIQENLETHEEETTDHTELEGKQVHIAEEAEIIEDVPVVDIDQQEGELEKEKQVHISEDNEVIEDVPVVETDQQSGESPADELKVEDVAADEQLITGEDSNVQGEVEIIAESITEEGITEGEDTQPVVETTVEVQEEKTYEEIEGEKEFPIEGTIDVVDEEAEEAKLVDEEGKEILPPVEEEQEIQEPTEDKEKVEGEEAESEDRKEELKAASEEKLEVEPELEQGKPDGEEVITTEETTEKADGEEAEPIEQPQEKIEAVPEEQPIEGEEEISEQHIEQLEKEQEEPPEGAEDSEVPKKEPGEDLKEKTEGEGTEAAEREEAKTEGEGTEAAEREEAKTEGEGTEAAEREEAKPEVTKVGDFVVKKQASFEDIGLSPEIELEYSISSEEEEEEEEEEEVEEEETIDRETAIERFQELQTEGRPIVKKNVFLLKRLAEYFRKRKMDHVYKHPEPYSAEKELKYHKQLLTFEDIRLTEANERMKITAELEAMKEEKHELVNILQEDFGKLIEKERFIGIGLVNTKTGKVIPDRVVEHLLSRQERKLKEVNEVRLAFIKLRDKVALKEAQLRALETFGENLHLIDFEQLRVQNQSFSDKIEERDDELQKLRNKATSAIQTIAHMREKSHATDEKMDELCELLEYTQTEVNNSRSYVTDVKKRRDWLRSETLRLRQEAGLLSHPRMLRHFEKSIDNATLLSAEVQNLKNDFYDQKEKLQELRKAIEAGGGGQPEMLEKHRFSYMPSVVQQKPTAKKTDLYSTFTSTDRRKSVKVTPTLLNQLSSARRASRVRRRSERMSIGMFQVMQPITKERPSFFPTLSSSTYCSMDKAQRFLSMQDENY